MAVAVSVNDPRYRAALARFNRQLRRLYRAAGEPPYREVASDCGVSVTTVHRYLNGVILPRMSFVSTFLSRYGDDIAQVLSTDELYELRTRWMDVRDVLRPIEADEGRDEGDSSSAGGALVHRLVAVPANEDDPRSERRRRSA